MNYKHAGHIVFVLLLVCIFLSCTPNSCLETTISTVKAGFYETGTGKALTADSVTLYGLGKESSKIYNKALNLKSISFPLDARSDTSIFVLRVNSKRDTLTLIYTSYTHLVSKECGFTFYHVLDTVFDSSPVLDFVKKNQNITTINEENIRIYY